MIVINKDGFVEYFNTFRPEVNSLREEDILGKHILKVYPILTEETSSLLKVLRSGTPIYNEQQYLETYKGECIYAVNSTLPIKAGDEIIGAVDVSRYLDTGMKREDIKLSLKHNSSYKESSKLYCLDDIITETPSMLIIKDKIRKISKTSSSVLIQGETGTGKELVAQAIHYHSDRHYGPFISQNCAAIPATLLEGILFGTVKGSYTGAENRKGLFELAQGGTLFLDEINSMEVSIQAKLLKAIEDKKIMRVGGTKGINIDVRIVSAVNEDPIKAIKKNKLREDLFFRLGVVQINLPRLKTRRKDIKLLTNYFIDKYNAKMKKNIIGISEKVESIFYNYSWPGNVRELKNIIEGAFNLASNNLIQEKNLPDYMKMEEKTYENNRNVKIGKESLKKMVEKYEKDIIRKSLDMTTNMVEAARLLKISKQSLKYKIDKYNLE